ncbi:MAG: hypothetical protein P8Y93_08135 [Acidobacteriota bacterium]|jgi:hypothetical protein
MTVDSHGAVRPLFCVGLLALVCALASFSFAQAPSQPASFGVEQSSLELGKVVAGETVTATFVFYNNGPADVHIIRAKPS